MAVQGGDPAAELKGARIILRDKQAGDAENDYRWRSDPELARLDAAIPLTMSFERYLKLFEDQMKYPTPGSLQRRCAGVWPRAHPTPVRLWNRPLCGRSERKPGWK